MIFIGFDQIDNFFCFFAGCGRQSLVAPTLSGE